MEFDGTSSLDFVCCSIEMRLAISGWFGWETGQFEHLTQFLLHVCRVGLLHPFHNVHNHCPLESLHGCSGIPQWRLLIGGFSFRIFLRGIGICHAVGDNGLSLICGENNRGEGRQHIIIM